MKYNVIKTVAVVSVLFFAGCGSDLDQPRNETVVGGKVVVDLDGRSIKSSLISKGVPGVDENTTVFGYKAYKIPYMTTDEEGNSVQVSGLMVVPTGVPAVMKQAGFSMVSDSHGTIFANKEAPTVIADAVNSPDGAPVVLTSLYAFVTLQADYIGFGDSLGEYHPFILKRSLANATVDFIQAAKTFAQNNEIPLNGQLFLTGYSEGGYASMAALQKIENEDELQVTLAAPMAGPYAVDVMAQGVLSQPQLTVPSFMANVGYAYALAYQHPLKDVINEPYASKLPTLFDGSKTRLEIDPELTTVTTGENGLFNPVLVNSFFTDPDNWFKLAVQENDLYQWAPQTPVKLVHCEGDSVIPYALSALTEKSMNAAGAASVELVPVEATLAGLGLGDGSPMDHAECATSAYGVTAYIFSQMRKATIGY
jgi:predicted esterase